MIVYHGSNVVVSQPEIRKSRKGNDFGNAFYVTPIKEQAERMATRKANIEHLGKQIVSVFEWDENCDELCYIHFQNMDQEWLEMVKICRNNPSYHHGYDIVRGKIADDRVGRTILFYVNGIIDHQSTIERLKYQKINEQIAFCSENALKKLTFKDSYEVKNV